MSDQPICPNDQTAPIQIPITDEVGQVFGNIYAEVVPLAGDVTGVRACLKPVSPDTPINTLAYQFGFHHFNWYQICTADSNPTVDWLGNVTKIPYIDPPAMGYGPVIDDQGNTDGVVMWADCRPWYYDEVLPGRDIFGRFLYDVEPWQYIGYQTFPDRLHFADTPVMATNDYASFRTWLVGVKADGSLARWFGGFEWTSRNDNGNRHVSHLATLPNYPSLAEYDWLIKRNKYVWQYDCTEIHFRPNIPVNPPKTS